MPARMECSAEGYEDNWIVIETPWTRGDTRRLGEATDDDAILDVLRSKLSQCHVITVDGAVLDSPADLTGDTLDDVDELVWGWLVNALYVYIAGRRELGKWSARASSATNGRVPVQTKAIAE